MGSIISPGIGSGLDIGGLVTQLVEAEGAPEQARLDRQEAGFQAKLSAFGTLRAALDEFRAKLADLDDLAAFQGRRGIVSDDTLFAATANSAAAPGRYAIEVLQLAQAHKLASSSYADSAERIGTGTLTISVGAGSFAVEIAEEGSSLAAIRDAINGAPGNNLVYATIVNASDGARLVLTAAKTGAANEITVTAAGGDGGLEDLVYDPGGITNLEVLSEALDAELRIEGFLITDADNTIENAVDGLSIDLLKAAPGTEATLEVSFDRDAARQKVLDLVEAWNALVENFDRFTSYDAENRIAGPLLGDATLRNLQGQLRTELGAGTLYAAGIALGVDGTLEVDETRLDAALADDFDGLGELFSAAGGLVPRLDARLEPYLDAGGLLDTRTEGLRSSIDDIGERRERLADRLAQVEARLFAQFNALDTLLAQLQQTSNFLSQQLARLPTPQAPSSNRGS